jgi:beta-galactosidase GanA
MVHDRLLDPAHLAPYATLVLPNLAALSDAQCDQLRAFVKNGGNLIATYETSLYDEWGVRRSDFASPISSVSIGQEKRRAPCSTLTSD